MMPARWLRWLAWSLFVLLVGAAVLVARLVREGEEALGMSDAAFHRGDVRTAALYARRAAILYVPGAPHVERAYARLEAIATGAEAAGDVASAEMAWRLMRSAAIETRHLWVARPAELERATRALARIQKGTSYAALRSTLARGNLPPGEAPPLSSVLLLAAGVAAAGAGMGRFALRGVTSDGRPIRSELGWCALLVALGAACWALGIWRA